MSKQPKTWTHWTDYRTRKLIRLYNEGVPLKEVATSLKVSKKAVAAHLRRLRVAGRIGPSTRHGSAVRWSPEQDAMILAGVEELAKLTGRSTDAIVGRLGSLRTLNLKRLHEPAA